MKDYIPLIATIISCILGLTGAGFGIFARWKASVEKGYAAQRDFAHLQRNFDQLVRNLELLTKEQDARFDRLDNGQSELRATLITLLTRKPNNNDQ
jgi:hypothetical protein